MLLLNTLLTAISSVLCNTIYRFVCIYIYIYMFIRPQSQELDVYTVRIFLYVYNIILVDFRVANDEDTSLIVSSMGR